LRRCVLADERRWHSPRHPERGCCGGRRERAARCWPDGRRGCSLVSVRAGERRRHSPRHPERICCGGRRERAARCWPDGRRGCSWRRCVLAGDRRQLATAPREGLARATAAGETSRTVKASTAHGARALAWEHHSDKSHKRPCNVWRSCGAVAQNLQRGVVVWSRHRTPGVPDLEQRSNTRLWATRFAAV
jgi:hypothetical protein